MVNQELHQERALLLALLVGQRYLGQKLKRGHCVQNQEFSFVRIFFFDLILYVSHCKSQQLVTGQLGRLCGVTFSQLSGVEANELKQT